jgi:hypothetical protein
MGQYEFITAVDKVTSLVLRHQFGLRLLSLLVNWFKGGVKVAFGNDA